MRRFEKAAEFVQSDTFGNVIDFFQAQRGQKKKEEQRKPKKPDYTPLYILGAIAVVVAIIKQ